MSAILLTFEDVPVTMPDGRRYTACGEWPVVYQSPDSFLPDDAMVDVYLRDADSDEFIVVEVSHRDPLYEQICIDMAPLWGDRIRDDIEGRF